MFQNPGAKLNSFVKVMFFIMLGASIISFFVVCGLASELYPAAIGLAFLGLIVFNVVNYIATLFVPAFLTLCEDTHELATYVVPEYKSRQLKKQFQEKKVKVHPTHVTDTKQRQAAQEQINRLDENDTDLYAIQLINAESDTDTIQRIDDADIAEQLGKYGFNVGSEIVLKGVENGKYSIEVDALPGIVSENAAAHIYVIAE